MYSCFISNLPHERIHHFQLTRQFPTNTQSYYNTFTIRLCMHPYTFKNSTV